MIAFAAVVLLAFVLPPVAGVQISIAIAAVMQGCLAALLARVFRLAPWWMVIAFCFPIAIVVSNAVQLPSVVYLAAFLLFLVLFWSTFRTQVPFYPSNEAVWRAVTTLLPEGRQLRVIDIGSGFGGMVMYLSRTRPECEVVGIELAPLPWICSFVRGRASGSAGRFVRGDYDSVNFGDFDVVFAYLSPAAMPALWRKAHTEMCKGGLLLSYEFAIPGVEPGMVIYPSGDGPALYGWRIG
ncbi:SAM-dependent methyltransferase [Noviherbaspirillum sp. ST9]|uniref:SAM-dependent methyltransferase n=1 Tax=Noviherbaspirillum sp. ST9 TaxID=3401606 RepID=UPI003B5877BE